MSAALSNDTSLAASARMKAEAQNLLDVAIDAKLSEKSSKYLKSLLEDVSEDFSTYDTSKVSRQDLDSDSDSSSSLDKDSSEFIGSADVSLSLSDSQDNESNVEANIAKKQLLMKILAFPASIAAKEVQQPTDFQRYQESKTRVEINLRQHVGDVNDQFDTEFGQVDRNQQSGNRGGDKLDSDAEIGRLTEMLKDRRMQFRDLVSIYCVLPISCCACLQCSAALYSTLPYYTPLHCSLLYSTPLYFVSMCCAERSDPILSYLTLQSFNADHIGCYAT